MTHSIRNRACALEDNFAYNQTITFRAEARRNKLAGLWAANCLGIDDAEAYAHEVVAFAIDAHSDAELVTKLRHEFDVRGIKISTDQLASKMRDLLTEAFQDLKAA